MAPDVFRTAPVDEMIEPLLAAFAQALGTGMSSLQEAALFTPRSWFPSEAREQESPVPPLDSKEKRRHRWGVRLDQRILMYEASVSHQMNAGRGS